MDNNISTILEKLYNNNLSFNDTCNKLSNLLLKETNEKIYKEFINIVLEEEKNGSIKN